MNVSSVPMRVARRLIEKPARTLLSALKWQKSALRNVRKAAPIFPATTGAIPNGLKIHLGAGEINMQGWINVDARPFDHIHAHTTSLELKEFADGAVSMIYMCHVLEHLSFDQATALLMALNRKLADGGLIIISVPDFDALVTVYRASGGDLDSIKYPLMGGQGYEYNFHKSVYNRRALEELLGRCGYAEASPWRTEAEFGCDVGDWSSATVKTADGENVPLSLNLRARKLAGRA